MVSHDGIDSFVNLSILILFYILGPAHQRKREMYQFMAPSIVPPQLSLPPPPPPPPPVNPSRKKSSVEWAIFTSLKGNAMPIKSVHLYNQMLVQLGSDLRAEWEALGRMLNVSEADLNAIKTNNVHVMKERVVRMFKYWVKKNGSEATVGVLVTAVYNLGPQYWNLLTTIYKYIKANKTLATCQS